MYFLWLWEVLKRAFSPAPRVTDVLQILAASALPAVSKIAGVTLPQNATENSLAYIGIAAVSFVIIRLFWAPYAIWKESIRETAELKIELSRPEKLEMAKMAELRASAKSELAGLLGQMALLSMRKNYRRDGVRLSDMIGRCVTLAGQTNSHKSLFRGVNKFGHMCFDIMQSAKPIPEDVQVPNPDIDPAVQLMTDMQRYLHGDLTAEGLALRLPPGTAPEILP